jgi:hypothetical protein
LINSAFGNCEVILATKSDVFSIGSPR